MGWRLGTALVVLGGLAVSGDAQEIALQHPWLKWSDLSDRAGELRSLYAEEDDGLLWFEGDRLLPSAAAAVEALVEAETRGLSALEYDAPLLLVRLQDARDGLLAGEERRLFDLGLTVGMLRFLADVHRGRVAPREVGFDYEPHRDEGDALAALREIRETGRMTEILERLDPRYPVYGRLRAVLPRYMALAKGPSLAPVPEVRKLSPGDAYAGLVPLVTRLQAFGDLPVGAEVPERYEGVLVDAVIRLQERFGLAPDGVVGRETFRAINRSPESLLSQIELTLERIRWLPDLLGQEMVVVDIPAFRLWAFDPEARPAVAMRVVVGQAAGHGTPVFLARMATVTFRPYWNVPPSIARQEIVPKIAHDPGYLGREDMEIVASSDEAAPPLPATVENLDRLARGTLRVRQRPGLRNALGRVAFSFPNENDIFMHDTPARELFARSRRDFSHGCVRLEDPLALARWLLRDQPEWTAERMDEAMSRSRPTAVRLTKALPVVIFYATVYVDRDGRAHFFEDIYGHDERLAKALARGPSSPGGRRRSQPTGSPGPAGAHILPTPVSSPHLLRPPRHGRGQNPWNTSCSVSPRSPLLGGDAHG